MGSRFARMVRRRPMLDVYWTLGRVSRFALGAAMIVNGPHKGKTFVDVIQRMRDAHSKRVADRHEQEWRHHYIELLGRNAQKHLQALEVKDGKWVPVERKPDKPNKIFWWF